jgi:transposase
MNAPRNCPIAAQMASRVPAPSLFCLPQYSPDLDPIEQGLAKLKQLLNKAVAG